MINMKTIKAFFLTTCMAVVGFTAHAAHWECNPSDYQYDMTAYVQLCNGTAPVEDLSNYEVAALVGNECRGVAQWVTTADGRHSYGLVRLWSNVQQGETLRWHVYDITKHKECPIYKSEVYLTFEAQTVAGLPSAPIVLNLLEKLPGDANDDGRVDVNDVTTTINYILGKNPSPFNSDNADVNNSGDVNVMDVTLIINIILGIE